jgi:hypothetical protein
MASYQVAGYSKRLSEALKKAVSHISVTYTGKYSRHTGRKQEITQKSNFFSEWKAEKYRGYFTVLDNTKYNEDLFPEITYDEFGVPCFFEIKVVDGHRPDKLDAPMWMKVNNKSVKVEPYVKILKWQHFDPAVLQAEKEFDYFKNCNVYLYVFIKKEDDGNADIKTEFYVDNTSDEDNYIWSQLQKKYKSEGYYFSEGIKIAFIAATIHRKKVENEKGEQVFQNSFLATISQIAGTGDGCFYERSGMPVMLIKNK